MYLASKLAKSGHEVSVFEQREAIGKVCCSGLFSERLFDFVPESRQLVENEINSCLINFPEKTLKIGFKKRFYVMEHAELDQMIAGLAQRAGAKIELGKKIGTREIAEIEKNYGRIIGCDGAMSAVRQYLGLPHPQFALGIIGFLDEEDSSDTVETWATERGFIWKIPRGKRIEYGIMEGMKEAKTIFDSFLEKNGLDLANVSSALIPRTAVFPKNEKIALCGDAAGLTKPWSGGGVVWGLAAANILLNNFPNFIKYSIEANMAFSPEIMISSLAKKLVYFAGYRFPAIMPDRYRIDGDFLLPRRLGKSQKQYE